MTFFKRFIATLTVFAFALTYILTMIHFGFDTPGIDVLADDTGTFTVSTADEVYAENHDHSPIPIYYQDSVAVRFQTNYSFTAITVRCPSWSDNIGTLVFTMYKWDSNYTKSVSSAPIIKKTFENFADNAELSLTYNFPAGNYILEITNPTTSYNTVGVWHYPSSNERIDFYKNGVPAAGSLNGYITTATSDTANFLADKVSLNVNPDNWDSVDGLGRELSEGTEKKQDKFVGMFFWTWHDNFISTKPRIVSDIINQYPDARNNFNHPAWEGTPAGTPYFWGESVFGFYKASDRYVLRKQAELLADADIDVIIFDCTNGTYLWESAYTELFEIFSEAQNDGVDVPQIAFMLNFAANENTKRQLVDLYSSIYSKNLYKDLWFYWEGKPLIMAYPEAFDSNDNFYVSPEKSNEIKNFFTFRRNEGSYFAADTSYSQGRWGWCSNHTQTKHGIRSDGSVEQMTVSVAQNSTDTELVAMNDPLVNVHGRSHTNGYYSYSYKKDGKLFTVDKNTENSLLYGLNFQQQWDYAISVDPDFIFVTGWNEWIAGRHETWQGTENAFPDQFSPEYSRDIEPSKGILKDHYYYQLVENVRRFKGAERTNETVAKKTITLSSGAKFWGDIKTSYDDYNDAEEGRNSVGYGNIYYTEAPTRNDIIHSKFAYDDENLYFMVQTENTLSPYTDENWMNLLLSINGGGENSWETFDYILNRTSPTSNSVTIEAFQNNSWNFKTIGTADYIIDNDTLIMSIPRALLGVSGSDLPQINFKWVDNVDINGDLMNLYSSGESAPNNRFTYRIDVTEGIDIVDTLIGDMNEDTSIDILDVAILYSGITGKTKFNSYQEIVADLNNDGKYNVIDVMMLFNLI